MNKFFLLLIAALTMLALPGSATEEAAPGPLVECVATVEAAPAESSVAAQAVVQETAAAEETQAAAVQKSSFCGTFWALAPALFAIVLALLTKEVYSSLFAGVVLGACCVTQFTALDTVDFVVNQGLITALKDTSGVFIFLVILGAFVCMINKTGGAMAFGEWAQTLI